MIILENKIAKRCLEDTALFDILLVYFTMPAISTRCVISFFSHLETQTALSPIWISKGVVARMCGTNNWSLSFIVFEHEQFLSVMELLPRLLNLITKNSHQPLLSCWILIHQWKDRSLGLWKASECFMCESVRVLTSYQLTVEVLLTCED